MTTREAHVMCPVRSCISDLLPGLATYIDPSGRSSPTAIVSPICSPHSRLLVCLPSVPSRPRHSPSLLHGDQPLVLGKGLDPEVFEPNLLRHLVGVELKPDRPGLDAVRLGIAPVDDRRRR